MDYKRVLRLHFVNHLSGHEIAESCGNCSKTTVNEFLKRFRESPPPLAGPAPGSLPPKGYPAALFLLPFFWERLIKLPAAVCKATYQDHILYYMIHCAIHLAFACSMRGGEVGALSGTDMIQRTGCFISTG